MALVTISGFPSSGKSRRAKQISGAFEQFLKQNSDQGQFSKVIIISDDSLHIKRSSYDESRSEKPARATLFAAMQRQMAPDTILIVDAPNYIKGFRYQMYCAAREMKLRVCTVHVVATKEQCREWNTRRQEENAYLPETLENLLFRYEEPSSMVRWDSPLFTVTWEEEVPPVMQIWEAITKGNIKPPTSAPLAVVKAPTDALQALEQVASVMTTTIISDQTGLGGELNLAITGPSATFKTTVNLPARHITLSEVQRLKRQFVTVHKKAITLGSTEKGSVDWDEESIARKFGVYLEEHLQL